MEGLRGPFNYVAQSKFVDHRRAVKVLWISGLTEPVDVAIITLHQFLIPVRFSLTLSPKFEHLPFYTGSRLND